MAYPGLNAKLNEHLVSSDIIGTAKARAKEIAFETLQDAIKSDWFNDLLVGKINEAAKSVGIDLAITNIRDKDGVRAELDRVVTAKVNGLAGTAFASMAAVNRDEVVSEVGRLVGEKAGLGDMSDIDKIRNILGEQLVGAFEGGTSLFGATVTAAIEKKVLSGWTEIAARANTFGNPMSTAGPPRDAAHAAERAAGRKRQAIYRRKHYQHWVPIGEGKEGNGRAGLVGKEAGNKKTVRSGRKGL